MSTLAADLKQVEQLQPYTESFAAIRSVERASLNTRLAYHYARAEALVATGRPMFQERFTAALEARETLWHELVR